MLEDGKIQLGEFSLPVAAERPPPAYSQLSSNVFLPNLKWVDSHKPIFRINVSMVSSVHPKVVKLIFDSLFVLSLLLGSLNYRSMVYLTRE